MRIIKENKMNLQYLKHAIRQPELYEKSTDKFWDDPYISEQLLKMHLNSDIEAASKTKATLEAEANFIINYTNMNSNKTVIDLGCGPGLYIKEFAKTGANITGVDISDNSLQYARETIERNYPNTKFEKMNYLSLDYKEAFDIATLIFYDFCVLSETEQSILITKVYDALKKEGIFVLDVVTENRKPELGSRISVQESGLWSSEPYVEILNTFMYDNPKIEGQQYTIIDEEGSVKIIRFYNRLFSLDEITTLFNKHNFEIEKVYKNLKGDRRDPYSETFGIFARKK